MEKEYRVCFSPNGLSPFTFKVPSFNEGVKVQSELCKFDLGQDYDEQNKLVGRCIAGYRAYRRRHGINHPDLIAFSTCTIDVKVDGVWLVAEMDGEFDDDGFPIEEPDPYCESYN